MNSFEPVYNKLNDLFINELPSYIQKVNELHNDGIIIKNFTNKDLENKCTYYPYFIFNIEDAEYSEKDRIIENTVFKVSFQINLGCNEKNQTILFWRYVEAVNAMINETENFVLDRILRKNLILKITF